MTEATSRSTYHATDGAAYEIFLGRWTRRLSEPLLDFAEFGLAGDLLDVGCGTGSLARAMATRWPERSVAGIDIAEPYVAYARAQHNPDNLNFKIGDACRIPFADRSFSGAAAQLVLNFVPDPLGAITEMKRVVASGGSIVATVWDFRGGLVYQRMFWDTAAGIDTGAASARDKLFSGRLALPQGLLQLFETGGLRDIQRTSITIRMDYENFDDYWRPLCGGQGPVGTYLEKLKPGLRDQIENAVRTSYLSGSPDGPRSMTATAWSVRGRVA